MSQELSYTVYHLLKEFDPEKKGFMPRARFYKSAFVLHRNLKRRGIDVKLPWCWYIYGPQVEMNMIPNDSYTLENLGEAHGYRLFYGEEPALTDDNKKNLTAIKYEIDQLKKQYLSTDDLIREVYSDPPKKVLRLFKEFDDFLKMMSEGQTTLNGTPEEHLTNQLNQISKTYSEEDFGEMIDEYLRIDDLIRASIKFNPKGYRNLSDLIHQFREVVATKASAVYYENLPDTWPLQRIRLMNERLELFRKVLTDVESDLYRNHVQKEGDANEHSKVLMNVAFNIAKEE